MRRYRFGRIAATLAVGYVAVIVVAGVIALVTGDAALLRRLVTDEWSAHLVPFTWWVEILLVACGFLQGWAYWQVLRGRVRGEPGSRGRAVGLLRAALYAEVAYTLLLRLPIPYQWWLGLPNDLVRFAVVWLFFAVLAGSLPRWLRLLGLAAGLLDAVRELLITVAAALGPGPLEEFVWRLPLGGVPYVIWLVTVLAGQRRDPRWSRATVRTGVLAAGVSFLFPGGGYAFVSFSGVDYLKLALMLSGVLSVFGLVWAARSAHELAGPSAEEPQGASAPAAPARAARRPWPLAALAVVPPLVPAAVNLIAYGMPMWIGPRGVVEDFLSHHPGDQVYLVWLSVDLLVGVGAPAVLVAIAAARGSGRLVRGTMWALIILAAAGVVTVLTTDTEADWGLIPRIDEERLRFYPDGLFVPDQYGQLRFGLSPLWYSAALAVSACMLFLLYLRPPVPRRRVQVLVTALGAFAALCFLPAADHGGGSVTTGEECSPRRDPRREADVEEPAGPLAFICDMRTHSSIKGAESMPDAHLLAFGHQLCDVFTRNDPGELARIRAVNGVNVRGLAVTLSEICPAAAAEVAAQVAAQEGDFAAFQAEEQRKCDATPRHRPRIRPAKAIRLKEPEWPGASLELYEHEEGETSRDADRYPRDGLVSGGPDHLILRLRSDFHACVTLETYTRRPPVEVKGWDEVVEAGYDSPTGRLVFAGGLSGTELPDLSLGGRKGHYRIRVHFAWFPWQGDRYGTQRLLIQAYPGPGDRLVTYRQRSRG